MDFQSFKSPMRPDRKECDPRVLNPRVVADGFEMCEKALALAEKLAGKEKAASVKEAMLVRDDCDRSSS